jgi:hypothetical protein
MNNVLATMDPLPPGIGAGGEDDRGERREQRVETLHG